MGPSQGSGGAAWEEDGDQEKRDGDADDGVVDREVERPVEARSRDEAVCAAHVRGRLRRDGVEPRLHDQRLLEDAERRAEQQRVAPAEAAARDDLVREQRPGAIHRRQEDEREGLDEEQRRRRAGDHLADDGREEDQRQRRRPRS